MRNDAPTSFNGIPIEGDFHSGYRRVQRPLEDFIPIFQAVLDDPEVEYFGWTQYTPYFNDGETCRFSAHGFWVVSPDQYDEFCAEYAWSDFDPEDYSLSYGREAKKVYGERGWGEWVTDPETEERKHIPGAYQGPDQERFDRLKALDDAVEDGEFNHVLLTSFGDHCHVRISREGILLEEYCHD